VRYVSTVLVPGECGDERALLKDAVELGVRCVSRSSFNTRWIRSGLAEVGLGGGTRWGSELLTGIEDGGVLYFDEAEASDSALVSRIFVFERSRGAGLFPGVTEGRILALTLVRRTTLDPDDVDVGVRVVGFVLGISLLRKGLALLGGVIEAEGCVLDF
jgi:hypothetical protein